jgi:medium-chain acyl-[acyl-carrier-protein] hydrolase
MSLTDWLPTFGEGIKDGEIPLFCFPYAGGAASAFRNWPRELPWPIRAFPVQLPGREARWQETAYSDMPGAVAALADSLSPALGPPLALFGHSMGAFIAFELARELRSRGRPGPVRLFVSGCRAPHLPDPDPPVYNMPADQFVRELIRLKGAPAEVLRNSEYMELMLPMLRADFALCDTYVYHPGELLECPISAFGGSDDRKIRPDQLTQWGQHTKAGYTERTIPGDHFFLNTSRADLLAAIAADLLVSTVPRDSQTVSTNSFPHHDT